MNTRTFVLNRFFAFLLACFAVLFCFNKKERCETGACAIRVGKSVEKER